MSPAGDERRLVVGAAIVDATGRVLAAQRTRPARYAGQWEFPGGKVEPGETPEQAVVRECREELHVDCTVGPVVGEVDIPIGRLRVYRAWVTRGEPVATEHAQLRWLAREELHTVEWIDADLPLVEQLDTSLSTDG
jgi:8-oxo-dGTP diphosphatase